MTRECQCAGEAAAVLTISTAHNASNSSEAFQARPRHMFYIISATQACLRFALGLFFGLIFGQRIRGGRIELDFGFG